jgi:hypothetical protein
LIDLGDYNGDGALDMAVGNGISNDVSVRLNLCETGTPSVPSPTATAWATPSPTKAQAPTGTPTSPLPSATAAVPTGTPTACAAEFSDVPPGHTFHPYVHCLACRGIVQGYGDGTFRPDSHVTRGQLAKIVSNAAGFLEDPNPQVFEDVPPSNPFYAWINRLARGGHMEGYPCGGEGEPCVTGLPYFRPFAASTRGQTAKIVAHAAAINDPVSGQSFEDVPPAHAFHLWVERLAGRGAMAGYECGGPGEPCGSGNLPYFRPHNSVTRGQASKIVASTFFPGCGP